jgi:SAM-dependent methyltransferase
MSSSSIPLHLGSPEEFAAVRDFLQRVEFSDARLCRLLALEDMSDLGRVQWEDAKLSALAAPLRWCLQILVRGLVVAESECRTICGNEVFAAFQALGLLRARKQDVQALVCPVWLYPVDGFVIASDRTSDPEGSEFQPVADVVFPAIYGGTLRFLRLLPEAHGAEALDLCGGTGIGALHLARSARTAVTADLTERSAFFAEFNARLNGVKMQSLCGDLYAPVLGRQFDLITAHPPFVPALGTNMVYRDGGETGEEVTRRTIEELPAHLRPGGTCVILCVARDTKEQALEHRVRDWLGPARDEFDIVFGLEKVLSVEEVVDSLRKRGQQIDDEEAKALSVKLRSLGTRQFVYGALVLHRCAPTGSPKPFRIGLTANGSAPDFERLLAWRRHCRQPGFAAWLNQSRPHFAPRLQLTARHVVQEGELVPAEFVFAIADGLEAALRPDAWVVPLLARLNGNRSVQEVFESAQRADELPEGFRLLDFAGLVANMIERGFLRVELP